MKKAIITILVLTFFLSFTCEAFSLEGLPNYINTPNQLAEWLTMEFRYIMEMNDNWQTPQETINLRRGDCEDFAILVSAILTSKNIRNEIVFLEFKGMRLRHALCVWKTEEGTYNFISNKKIYMTNQTSIHAAVKRYYPDASGILLARQDREFKKKLKKLSLA